MYKALSLGWGIQSFTLASMIALKEIEPVDVVIWADTKHESKLTYEFRAKWEPWLIEHGLNVVTVSEAGNKNGIIDKWGGVSIPAFTVDEYGKKGQIKRQCTSNWKRDPIKRYLQQHRNKQQVEMWIGISIDEWTRAKDAPEQYITNRWPLIEKRISRADCASWLLDRNLEVPPKSACTFCPFKTRDEWSKTRNVLEDWQEALYIDSLIRDARPPEQLFIHKDAIPIDRADTMSDAEKGQLGLFDIECDSGFCFL